MSLFDQQDGREDDALQGPFANGDDMQPSAWQGFSPLTPAKGALAGAEEGMGILAGSVPAAIHTAISGAMTPGGIPAAIAGRMFPGTNPLADLASKSAEDIEKPWMPQVKEGAQQLDETARRQAKELMPDPAVSGSGTNLIFGFAKMGTQAAGSMLTREPLLAAPLFGYLQGMGTYRDLKDQGVDDNTAQRAATLAGAMSGASFLAPLGLPAKWLSEMPAAAQAVTQLATGASINTAQGMANRYLTGDLLEKSGYPQLAAQYRVMDGQAMLADILSGAFYGGAHFFNGRAQTLADAARKAAESGVLDPAIRDAAKAAQDARQAAIDRAPGIPLDGESAGAHSEALEKALGDLFQDKSVDVGHTLDDSTFLRQPQSDEIAEQARSLIHEEFIDAGVMGEASRADAMERAMERYYAGEKVTPYEGDVKIPTDAGEVNADDATARLDKEAEEDEHGKLLNAAVECAAQTL